MARFCGQRNARTKQDSRARADVNRWLFWDAAHFAQGVAALVFERLVKRVTGRGEPDPAEIKRGEGLVAQFFPVLEGQLAGGKTWVTQDGMTLADVSLATTLALAGPAGIDLEPFPSIRAWHGCIRELDAWKATEPPRT
jgi:glutathione S-transferase